MVVFLDKYFNKIFWLTCFASFIVICLRAFCIPFSHDETATFFFYVQSDNYLPYKAHIYTNNHVLNSALTNVCYHIAGSNRFVLRLPNILSFIFLCIGTFRHFKYLKNYSSKILLTAFLILTFNFLDFFELCRGYGLSMGFMVLGLSYLHDYLSEKKFKQLILFSFFIQLALAANLIFVVIVTVLLFYIYIFQFSRKIFFNIGNILLQLVNISILVFWIKFSFFYKEHGSLDAGAGDNYWEVTFKSLMQMIYGTETLWLQLLVLISFCIIILFAVYSSFRVFSLDKLFQTKNFYAFFLAILVAAFYLQKKILDVNYPEDRTGLFFFVLFALSFSFFLDDFRMLSRFISPVITVSTLLFFIISFNLQNFSSFFYHTMPKALYEQLKSEFEKEKQVFTIGGHRVREMNYTFLNYRGQSVLNPMDNSEEMQMNCDYYFAMKREQPFYKEFYDEIGYDEKWERVLLKRKEKITHHTFFEAYNKELKGEGEFHEFIRFNDTSFAFKNPVEMYVSIKFSSVPRPFNAFLTLQVQNEKHEDVWYKRVPLNWLGSDLNGQEKHLKLTGQSLPPKTTLIAYIWNIEKQNIHISINDVKLYQLSGKGVNYRVPTEFYLMNYQITKKPLL
ncbi:MAG: hypothetical protein K0S32_1200 [Bacteroidetes bacterium]|nr:hypothetical protein [Bacteroidota bacterium]